MESPSAETYDDKSSYHIVEEHTTSKRRSEEGEHDGEYDDTDVLSLYER